MKTLLTALLFLPVILQAQTFQVSDVEWAKEPLAEYDSGYAMKMIYGDQIEANGIKVEKMIPALSIHPFVYAVHEAFNEHRPLVISPDMIWLLISQSLSDHIGKNSEKFRDKLVDFEGKKLITIRRDEFQRHSPQNDWYGVFDEIEYKINTNTKINLGKTFVQFFSTTDKKYHRRVSDYSNECSRGLF